MVLEICVPEFKSPLWTITRNYTRVPLSLPWQLSPWRRKIISIPPQNFLPSSNKMESLFSTDLFDANRWTEKRKEKTGGGKFEIYPSSYSFKIAYERKYIFHSIPKLTCTNNRVNRIESFLSTDLSIRIDEQTEKRETRKEKEIYIYPSSCSGLAPFQRKKHGSRPWNLSQIQHYE